MSISLDHPSFHDAGNVFWSEIPATATVRDLGSSFVALYPDGTGKLVYWTGSDAMKAQDHLRKRARKDAAKNDAKVKP
jgi:hypothetical protein